MPWVRAVPISLFCLTGCVPSDPDSASEWIVFSSNRSGGGDLYAVVAGEAPRVIVETPTSEGAVRYDPALDRIVYSRFDSLDVMLMSAGAELFPDPNGDVAPVWSRRGSIAFVVEGEEEADLFIAARDGTRRRRLTHDDLIERYPAWDPGGERLVYAKQLASGWDLHILDVASGEETRVTSDGTYVGHPAWSPDGASIAFDRMYDGQTEIVVLDLISGEVRRITENAENDLLPAWSAEGTRITFAGVRSENWDVWAVGADGTALERITTDLAFDGGPIFVPASALGR